MRTATSSPPRPDRPNDRSASAPQLTSGKRSRNSSTSGATCRRPNRIGAVTRNSPRGAVPAPAAACSISSRSASTRRAPAGNAARLGQADRAGRPVEQPHAEPSSNSATSRVTAAGERSRRRAASAKLPRSATSAKHCQAVGPVHIIAIIAIISYVPRSLSFFKKRSYSSSPLRALLLPGGGTARGTADARGPP